MKYTRLSLKDLKDLEKEFIEFLIINGIEAKEWEEMKKEDMGKVAKIIDQFSDVIWESVLQKTEMVEHRHKSKLTICHVEKDELVTLIIHSNVKDLDLSIQKNIDRIISEINKHKVTVQRDKIVKSPQEQLFELIQTGFFITKDPLYKKLIERKFK